MEEVLNRWMRRVRQADDGSLSPEGRVLLAAPTFLLAATVYSMAGVPVRPPVHPPLTLLDQAVPFIPATIWIYLPAYWGSFLLLIASIKHGRAYRAGLAALLSLNLLAVPFFLYAPIASPRPLLEGSLHGNLALVQLLYQFDTPYNTFPSLHVAHSALAAGLLTRFAPQRAWLGWAMNLGIAVSVLTLKQHHAVDVLGGWVLAAMGGMVWSAAYRLDAGTVEKLLMPVRERRRSR